MEEIRKELDVLRTQLRVQFPFLASLLHKVRVIIEDTGDLIHVTPDNELCIGRTFVNLGGRERLFVLAHGILHVALLHARRGIGKEPIRWNLAADVVVNHALSLAGLDVPAGAVTGERLDLPSGWENQTVEKIYEMIPSTPELPLMLPGGDLLFASKGKEGERGRGTGKERVVIQEGESQLYERLDGEELQRRWRREFHKAWQLAKMAGKCPSGLERWVERLLKPSTDVRALLRAYIREGLGRMVVANWLRPSRKNPDLPWVKRLGLPTIHALVDTSGSIGEEELSLFLGTLQEFRNQTEITVTCWDAEAYETVKVRGRDILPWVKGKIKGGGGTVIAPALKKTLERMKPGDIVVVLTDGYIYDKTDAKTRDLMARIAARAAASVFLWTGEEVKALGWRSLKLALPE
jgi:predicted metal-dependent peptidase